MLAIAAQTAGGPKTYCLQITATHQTNLNNRPVRILVGDIYFPRTHQLAANTHNRVTPVSRNR